MKVAIVASKFPPIVGGGETIVCNLANDLGKRGHEVTIVTSKLAGVSYDSELFKVKTINGFEDFCSGSGNFEIVCERLYEILSAGDFDIVHVHNFLPMFLVSQFADKLSAKVVFTYHNTPNPPLRIIGYFKNFKLDEEFTKSIINSNSYNLLLAGSKFYFDWALELGTNPSKLHLTYFGIDTSRFDSKLKLKRSALRKKMGLPNDKFVITFPSRAIARKGALEAIQALAILREKGYCPILFMPAFYSPFDLNFAKELFLYIEKNGLSKQVCIPKNETPYKEMPEVYAASDIVIMPSYHEGLGLAALEAMSVGIPVISTKVSGIKEIIDDGYNGLLVEPKNALDLACAILHLKENKNLMERLSSNGRTYANKRFSSEKLVKRIENLYKSLLI